MTAPIILPPPTHPAWARAAIIAKALRAKGKSNPFIVGALANAYAESAWTAVIAGDHGQSFGPWQCKWQFYGTPILAALGVDIRTEPDLGRHVEAILFVLAMLPNMPTLAALDAATTGEDATRIWASGFERASAGGAVDRRAAIAPQIEVWLAKLA